MAKRRKTGAYNNQRWYREFLKSVDQGMIAAAEILRAAVVDKFVPGESGELGYIHGDYATGAASDVQIGAPYTREGIRRIRVFTNAERDGRPYPFFWEFGHLDMAPRPFFRDSMEEVASRVAPLMARQITAGSRQVGARTTAGQIELAREL
jgi:hypothetical protein